MSCLESRIGDTENEGKIERGGRHIGRDALAFLPKVRNSRNISRLRGQEQ